MSHDATIASNQPATRRSNRPPPIVHTDTDLLDSIRHHGLEVLQLEYHRGVDSPLRQVWIRGVSFSLERKTSLSPWAMVRLGTSGRLYEDALPGDVWRAAQWHRERARKLDRLMGVLEDMGMRPPSMEPLDEAEQ